MKSGIWTAVFALFFASAASGQDSRHATEESDTGLHRLQTRGIDLAFAYTGDFWTNLHGGLQRGSTHMHDIDVSALLDTARLGLWPGGRFFVYALSTPGGTLLSEEIVGDTQVVSNIEAPHSTRLYELWYEQLFWDGKLSLLLGVHDFNSEFAVTENGSLFLNSSFGISKDISGSSRAGIFPLAAPALRAKYIPNGSLEFLLGIYNGDPGDPEVYRHFPRFTFNGRGGALVDFETMYHFSRDTLPATVKVGYWRNTGRFEDIRETDTAGNPKRHWGNQGVYLVADKMITGKEDDRHLSGFLQLGWAPDENVNEFGSYFGGGFKYTGILPGRAADETGIAFASAVLGDKLAAGPGRAGAETALEITYRAIFNRHFALQPDLQIVFNPGADSTLGNAVVLGARLELTY